MTKKSEILEKLAAFEERIDRLEEERAHAKRDLWRSEKRLELLKASGVVKPHHIDIVDILMQEPGFREFFE